MQSMTGYGRGRVSRDGRELLMELKTVNHRFLDISLRMPKALSFAEDELRAMINASPLGRGHVDVLVTYQNTRTDAKAVALDQPLLAACRDALCGQGELSLYETLTLTGALTVTQAEEDAQEVSALCREAFGVALEQLLQMRLREGRSLQADLGQKLDELEALIARISLRAPEVPMQYRERLSVRIAQWDVGQLEPQRIAQEVALLADRCAIDEELARLQSHVAQFRVYLAAQEEAGRKLDFLIQEMNREVNTIGSKASDGEIAQRVVDAKCVIEKLREQTQNVV